MFTRILETWFNYSAILSCATGTNHLGGDTPPPHFTVHLRSVRWQTSYSVATSHLISQLTIRDNKDLADGWTQLRSDLGMYLPLYCLQNDLYGSLLKPFTSWFSTCRRNIFPFFHGLSKFRLFLQGFISPNFLLWTLGRKRCYENKEKACVYV